MSSVGSSPPPGLPPLATLAHLQAQEYFQVAVFVVLIYDHLITFSDEVEHVWKQRLSLPSVLFLLNRYGTPLEFTAVLVAFHHAWPPEICKHFVKMEGAGAAASTGVCQLIMILRVYALYRGNKYILLSLLSVLCAQIILQAVATNGGFPIPLPSGCILVGTRFFAAYWIAPLVTDSCVFGLTLWKTLRFIKGRGRTPMLELFFRDGMIYFLVIFTANFMNVVTYLTVEADLQALFAPFCQVTTSVMISRLVLNLRGFNSDQNQKYGGFFTVAVTPPYRASRQVPSRDADLFTPSVETSRTEPTGSFKQGWTSVGEGPLPFGVSAPESTRVQFTEAEEYPLVEIRHVP